MDIGVRLAAVAMVGGALWLAYGRSVVLRRELAKRPALLWLSALLCLTFLWLAIGLDPPEAMLLTLVVAGAYAAWVVTRQAAKGWSAEEVANIRAWQAAHTPPAFEPEVYVCGSSGSRKAFLIVPAGVNGGAVVIRYDHPPTRPRRRAYSSLRDARQAVSDEGASPARCPELQGPLVWRRWPTAQRLRAIVATLWVCYACKREIGRSNSAYQLLARMHPAENLEGVAVSVGRELAPLRGFADCLGSSGGGAIPHCRFSCRGLSRGLGPEMRDCLEQLSLHDAADTERPVP